MKEIQNSPSLGTNELNNKEKSGEFLLFLTLWDEQLGLEVLGYYPKSFKGDLESLSNKIFSTFDFFYNKPDEQYQSRKITLPIVNLNRKAYVLLDIIHNREVRGGLQPFIVVLLVPDSFLDDRLEEFDTILSKIAKKYQNEKKIVVEELNGFG